MSRYTFSPKNISVQLCCLITIVTCATVLWHAKGAYAACTTPTTNYGTVTETVDVQVTGTYQVWSNIYTTNSSDNSYMLEVDGAGCYNVGGSTAMPTSSWNWIDYQNGNTAAPIDLPNLAAGTHTLTLVGTEPGVEIDRMILTPDMTCTPSGDGSNCLTTTVTTPAPTVTLTAKPTSVESGSSTTLTWSSTNATACSASGAWSGTESTSGSISTGELTATSSYTITCTGAGGSGDASTTVTVSAAAPPTPTAPKALLTSPVDGSTAQGTVNIAGTASDSIGVTKVEFLVDGSIVNTDTTAPYSYAWDSTKASNGVHTVTMTAFDAAGLQTSDSVSVDTENSQGSIPSAPTNVQATLGTVGDSGYPVALTWDAPTNPDPEGYYIVRNGVTIAPDPHSLF